MCTDNTAMDFYALNFPFTLNLQLEPSNLPSVWCEREDEGKSASLKSCPRHQTVKSSDAQSQEKTRKMNLFFFFFGCTGQTDTAAYRCLATLGPFINSASDTGPGNRSRALLQSWLDSDRCRFQRGRPHWLRAWQLYPTANTTADLSDQHQSNRSHNAPVKKKKKIHLTLEKDIFREHNSRVVMTAVTITEIQPLLPLALSVTASFHCLLYGK